MTRARLTLALLWMLMLPLPALAQAEMCESAAVTAARETGVPLDWRYSACS